MSPPPVTDHFLGEDDLDLQNLTWEELLAEWDAWLHAASVTDSEDADLYSHGVFVREPSAKFSAISRADRAISPLNP